MKKRIGAGKSYADILTILLVIIIIAIMSLLGYFAYKVINKNNVEKAATTAYDEFLAAAEENKKVIESNNDEEKKVEDSDQSTEIDYDKVNSIIESQKANEAKKEEEKNNNASSQVNSNAKIKKTYMGNYEVKGIIDIPKTNCHYSILEKVTVDSLKKSVAILDIVSNPELNETVNDLNVPGTNAFILGHNYLNGQFFSNNDKLVEGDIIKITDQYGNQVTYTIYKMFYAKPDDVSFMERDIDINTREITLQTCNENSSERLIILAKDN